MRKKRLIVLMAVGAITTAICAMYGDLPFTIIGVICLGLNIYNYIHADDKIGE